MISFFLNNIPRPILIRLSYIIRPFIDWWYRGNVFEDPINQKKYRKFLNYGYENTRKNVLAPGTLSLERHRLLWLYLKNETSFFKSPLKVLHVAPEQCFYHLFKNLKNLQYTTTDLYSPLADVKADVCNLPFESESFDVVFCNHVLEHVVEDQKALTELYRVLKPSGFGIFQVPQDYNRQQTYEDFSITNPAERKIHFGQYDHVRVYGLDFFDKLKSVGFKVSPFVVDKQFTKEQITQYALMQAEILPVCFK